MRPFIEIPTEDGKVAVPLHSIDRLEEVDHSPGTTVHLSGDESGTIQSTMKIKALLLKMKMANRSWYDDLPAPVEAGTRKRSRKRS